MSGRRDNGDDWGHDEISDTVSGRESYLVRSHSTSSTADKNKDSSPKLLITRNGTGFQATHLKDCLVFDVQGRTGPGAYLWLL